jgi:signal transduction histidine kinase/ActR/RegA family two-component response regulator
VNSTMSPTTLEQELRDINEALLISSVRQHELTERAEKAGEALRASEAALRESEERLARELAATRQLQSFSTMFIEGGDTASIYQKIVEAAAAIMRSDGASMQMVDEDQDALRLLAYRGFDPAFGETFRLTRSDTKTSCSMARGLGRRVIVPDVETCDFIVDAAALEDLRKASIRAVQSTPLFSRSGRLLGVISTHWHHPHMPAESDLRQVDILARQATDLIERTQAEDVMRQSERKYRSIFDGAAVCLWEQDFSGVQVAIEALRSDGVQDFRRYFAEHPEFVQRATALIRVLDVNEATVKMFEARDKTELLGSLPKIFVTESLPVFMEELVTVAESRTSLEAEVLLNTVRGNRIWVLFTMTLPPTSEKLDRVLFSVLDITERKRAEDLLREADRRKDEFLATLAHELRNPLAPLRNSLDVLRLAGDSGPTAEHIHAMMERQVNHMVRLVDDLLEVSRISRGNIELRKARVDVAAIVRTAVETSTPLIESGRHLLSITLPPEPMMLDGDAVRLTQALANLLNNAAKYTKAAGQIWLTARRDGASVVLSVRDRGNGISAEMLPRVFEMFMQAERGQGGLGIGLALVRNIVQMHDGSVEAHSEGLGRGSEFIIRLPLATEPFVESDRVPDVPQQAVPSLRRILLVDDNRDVADALAMLLKFLGADVHVVNDGPSALDSLNIVKPHVVFLDIGMPGMDGYEVARRIHEQSEFRDVPLVALTGWGQDEDRRRSADTGFQHHLVKPVALGTLQALLTSLEQRNTAP